jgi:hypothetical protein
MQFRNNTNLPDDVAEELATRFIPVFDESIVAMHFMSSKTESHGMYVAKLELTYSELGKSFSRQQEFRMTHNVEEWHTCSSRLENSDFSNDVEKGLLEYHLRNVMSWCLERNAFDIEAFINPIPDEEEDLD